MKLETGVLCKFINNDISTAEKLAKDLNNYIVRQLNIILHFVYKYSFESEHPGSIYKNFLGENR